MGVASRTLRLLVWTRPHQTSETRCVWTEDRCRWGHSSPVNLPHMRSCCRSAAAAAADGCPPRCIMGADRTHFQHLSAAHLHRSAPAEQLLLLRSLWPFPSVSLFYVLTTEASARPAQTCEWKPARQEVSKDWKRRAFQADVRSCPSSLSASYWGLEEKQADAAVFQ